MLAINPNTSMLLLVVLGEYTVYPLGSETLLLGHSETLMYATSYSKVTPVIFIRGCHDNSTECVDEITKRPERSQSTKSNNFKLVLVHNYYNYTCIDCLPVTVRSNPIVINSCYTDNVYNKLSESSNHSTSAVSNSKI